MYYVRVTYLIYWIILYKGFWFSFVAFKDANTCEAEGLMKIMSPHPSFSDG